MQADPAAQRRLLEMSAIDISLTQLDHRRRNLPEHQELAALAKQRTALTEQNVAVETQLADLAAEQDRLDADLDPARARLARDEQLAQAGMAGDQRALRGILDEIEHLKGRISDLEDATLELMERTEQTEAMHARLLAEREDVERLIREALGRRDAVLHELNDEEVALKQRRNALTAQGPTDLLALYEKIASRNGTGAAELRAGRCGGCGLQVDATDLHRFAAAAPTDVLRCEECGRILVRTDESGLR